MQKNLNLSSFLTMWTPRRLGTENKWMTGYDIPYKTNVTVSSSESSGPAENCTEAQWLFLMQTRQVKISPFALKTDTTQDFTRIIFQSNSMVWFLRGHIQTNDSSATLFLAQTSAKLPNVLDGLKATAIQRGILQLLPWLCWPIP